MADIAGIISQGTGYRLAAEQSKGEALSKIGGAIGQGVTSAGIGIFRMAQKAKEEKEVKDIDEAFKAVSLAGDLTALPAVASKLRPTTQVGRERLLHWVNQTRGIAKDMVNIEADKAALTAREREAAEAPVRREAIAWARKNPLSNDIPPEYADFFKDIRAEQDQAREIEDARALEESEGLLGGRSPGALTDEELAAVKSPRVKGILRGQRDTSRRAEDTDARLREKAERDARFRSLKAQGMVEVTDPDTGEVRVIPDVSSERYAERTKAQREAARRMDRALALAEEKERRAAENDRQGDAAKALSERRAALADYRAAFRLMQDDFGEMRDDVDPEEYQTLYEKIQTMTGELGTKAPSTPAGKGDAIDRLIEGLTPDELRAIMQGK